MFEPNEIAFLTRLIGHHTAGGGENLSKLYDKLATFCENYDLPKGKPLPATQSQSNLYPGQVILSLPDNLEIGGE